MSDYHYGEVQYPVFPFVYGGSGRNEASTIFGIFVDSSAGADGYVDHGTQVMRIKI